MGRKTMRAIIVLLLLVHSIFAHHPGARTKGCSWVDSNGDLWLFGGQNYQSIEAHIGGHLNDLWKYDVRSLEWKWIRGNNDPNFLGSYSTLGLYTDSTSPPSMFHPACYQRHDERRILLGIGPSTNSTDILLDQWSFSLSKNQWAWTFGNRNESLGIYVNRGLFSEASIPRPRMSPNIWYTKNAIYMFGGMLSDNNVVGDLWKFDLTQNIWAWISGSSAINIAKVPGTQGVSSPSNFPGNRYACINWVGRDGTLWLMGGYGVDQNGKIGIFNDVWFYNPILNEWTWIKGAPDWAPLPGTLPTYGQLNQPSPNNVMGARRDCGSWYDDVNDLVYIFGGLGVDEVGTFGHLADFWTYRPSTNEWTWIGGTTVVNTRPIFGDYRVRSSEVLPNAVFPFTWITNDTLWLYGGNWQEMAPLEFFSALWSYNVTSGKWMWVDGFKESNMPVEYPDIAGQSPTLPPNTENEDHAFAPWQVFSSDVNLFNRRLLFGVGIAGVVIVDSIILVILACTGVIKIPSKE